MDNIQVKLLIVEDDQVLGKSICNGLTQEGYYCRLAKTGTDALNFASEEQFNIVILDLALEDLSALAVLRNLRESHENANVIMLTPLESRQERKAGLEAGADDFLVKPFAMNEMRARVEAALIRSRMQPRTVLECGPLSMNLTSRRVTNSGQTMSVTPTEFRILEILMRNVGKPVSRTMLCEILWEPEWEGVTNVIEVHMNRLRTKLRGKSESEFIKTIRGVGYMLVVDQPTVNAAETAPSEASK
ncbi:MAG: response regulator transcription factor [Pirellulaceae bacterium]